MYPLPTLFSLALALSTSCFLSNALPTTANHNLLTLNPSLPARDRRSLSPRDTEWTELPNEAFVINNTQYEVEHGIEYEVPHKVQYKVFQSNETFETDQPYLNRLDFAKQYLSSQPGDMTVTSDKIEEEKGYVARWTDSGIIKFNIHNNIAAKKYTMEDWRALVLRMWTVLEDLREIPQKKLLKVVGAFCVEDSTEDSTEDPTEDPTEDSTKKPVIEVIFLPVTAFGGNLPLPDFDLLPSREPSPNVPPQALDRLYEGSVVSSASGDSYSVPSSDAGSGGDDR